MKKYILASLVVLFVAATSYAAYEAVDGTGKTLGSTKTTVVKGSKGVMVDYGADTSTSGQGYVLGAYHGSGTQTFATSSGDTKIFKQDGTAKAIPTTVPTGSATADMSGSGFTAM
ncbi:MAG: hypothetical protein HYV06_07805 [Deltaproteobacteria bacterium]|nr:hypothetical protein [Deltaproteobacteria bacterium]